LSAGKDGELARLRAEVDRLNAVVAQLSAGLPKAQAPPPSPMPTTPAAQSAPAVPSSSRHRHDSPEFQRSVITELSQLVANFGPVPADLGERLRTAEEKLNNLEQWTLPMLGVEVGTGTTATFRRDTRQQLCVSGSLLCEAVQRRLLDGVTRDYGASDAQIDQRRLLNRRATSIIDGLQSIDADVAAG